MGGSSKSQVVGYKYNLGVHMGLAHGPLDAITQIDVDRRVAWEGLSSGGTITVDAPNLFGGDKREGGISGLVDVEMGDSLQLQNSYLQTQLGTHIPAFRGVACLVLNQCYMGNNPYLKPWAITANRTQLTSDGDPQWYSSTAAIGRANSDCLECDALDTYVQGFGGEGFNLTKEASPGNTATNVSEFRTVFSFPFSEGGETIDFDKVTNNIGNPSTSAITVDIPRSEFPAAFCEGDPRQDAENLAIARLSLTDAAGFPRLQVQGQTGTTEGSTFTGGVFFRRTGDVTTADLSTGSGVVPYQYTYNIPYTLVGGPQAGAKQTATTQIAISFSVSTAAKTLTVFLEALSCGTVAENRANGGSSIVSIGTIDLGDSLFEDFSLMTFTLSAGDPYVTDGYEFDTGNFYHDLAFELSGSFCLWEIVDGSPRQSTVSGSQTFYRISQNYFSSVLGNRGSITSPGGLVAASNGDLLERANLDTPGIYLSDGIDCGELWAAWRQNDPDGCSGNCTDMNPAHIIRECLTDEVWGLGYSESDVDDASFTAAADTLFAEAMGISILWDRETVLEDFIGEILRHIDAVLYVSRETGKFVLKLIREESPTITLDESNVASVANAKRPTVSELTNAVSVVYWDSETDEDASLTIHNEALRQAQGVEIATTVQYPGFSNRDIASKVAQRDLRALSTPLLSCEITSSRAAADLNVGDAFILNWPDLNISNVTMRANEIDYGDGEDNSIRITALQDVFTTPTAAPLAAPAEVWIDPAETLPDVAQARLVTETPYYPLVLEVGDREAGDILADDPDAGFLLVSAGRLGTELNADVLVDTGTGFENSATVDFHPYAQLTADITEITTAFTVDGGKDLDLVEVGSIAQIDDELVRIDTIDVGAGTVTVGRGILDTSPRPHLDNAFILFWGEFAVSDDEQYAAAESIDVKLTPTQGGNTLAEASAPTDSITFNSRAIRPYPPGNLQVDAVSYPVPNTWGGDHTFTWAHRDRLQQTDGNLFDHTTGDIGPEAGTTYRVDAFAYNASEVETQFVDVTLASVTTWTYDAALVLSDPNVSDPPVDAVRLVFLLYSVRDGYDSQQAARVEFTV